MAGTIQLKQPKNKAVIYMEVKTTVSVRSGLVAKVMHKSRPEDEFCHSYNSPDFALSFGFLKKGDVLKKRIDSYLKNYINSGAGSPAFKDILKSLGTGMTMSRLLMEARLRINRARTERGPAGAAQIQKQISEDLTRIIYSNTRFKNKSKMLFDLLDGDKLCCNGAGSLYCSLAKAAGIDAVRVYVTRDESNKSAQHECPLNVFADGSIRLCDPSPSRKMAIARHKRIVAM